MSVEKIYYVGDVWEIDCAIEATRTKTAVDPPGLHILVTRPDLTTATMAPTKDAVGKDHVAVPLTKEGTWQATFIGNEGEYQGVETISVSVKKAPGI